MRNLTTSLTLLFCLLFAQFVRAQQPTATTPPQPAAHPGQTQQPQAPQRPNPGATPEASPQEENLQQENRRVQGPPRGFGEQPQGPVQAMTLQEAIQLALKQTSAFQQAQFDERIAREDVRQARAAFLPKLTVPLTYFGTTPSRVRDPGEPPTFSYASSVAINETVALLNAGGEIDLSGRLRAALRRSNELLAAARAGTLVARRALVINTVDAYYGMVLARQKRRLAEETLSLAEGFVKVAEGIAGRGEDESGGADALRARAQVVQRRDELQQARAGESAAMDILRVLTGVEFNTQINVTSINENIPTVSDFESYTEEQIRTRPELQQIEAQRRAALADARAARADRLPQMTYNVNGGFDAGDIHQLNRFSGGSAIVTLTVPVFDFGASRSRETQARLRAEQLDSQRELAMRQLRQEFYTARAAALAALARVRDAQSGVTAAQQNLTLIFARYRVKKASITDVVDAQAAYAEARMAYAQAIVDYHTARVRLEANPGQ